MSDLSNKVILTVAHTGAWPKKTDTPYVPLTPKEIAADVLACEKAGASVSHIHVRDDNSNACMDFDKFKEAVDLIRAAGSNMVLNLTTSGGLGLTDEIRQKPFVELRPEMASYDCGTMNWQHSGIFENSPRFLESTAVKMRECNVKAEIEIFDISWIYNATYLLKKGFLQGPQHFQFVMGAANGIPATVENLCLLVRNLPQGQGHTWSAFGIGQMHLPIIAASIALGGHVRIGMEDNIFLSKGVLAESNVQFVERTKKIIEALGKEVATPDEARQILGIKK
nr:3-keto-5-aminohexanoate cleavage protein [uncultured Holophaga sp.]